MYFCPEIQETEMRNRKYTKREELANTLSHGVGLLLGVVVGYQFLSIAFASKDLWTIISIAAYLFGMLASYLTSTWYHATSDPEKKATLQKWDHAAIYFHIAGTYAPFTLLILREQGLWGWSIFTAVYIAAFMGTYMSFRKLKKHSNLETICFVLMGCTILIALKPLYDSLADIQKLNSLYWLIGGGAAYIIGAVFYSLTKKKYMHTVFHLFVLIGSICHMIAIYVIIK